MTVGLQFKWQRNVNTIVLCRYSPTLNKKRVVPSNTGFFVPKESQQFLSGLTRPVAVVTIAGLYRTGKSYLLSRLVSSNTEIFKVGSSTNSVTKGLIAYGKTIPAYDENGIQFDYILIDSQGLGSSEQEAKYDIKLLMLIFLLSNTVVYNSVGALDEIALDQLRVVLNLNKCLKSKPQNRPRLIWVLRDFALQLIDKYGTEMTPNEYFQKCLQEMPGNAQETRKKNSIRRAIKDNLGERSCHTLVRPTIHQQELHDIYSADVRSEFDAQIQLIKCNVFRNSSADISKINGKKVTGNMLRLALAQYVESLNKDQTPQINDIWELVAETTNEEIIQSCCQQIQKQLQKIQLPLPKPDLKRQLNQIENNIYSKLEQTLTNSKDCQQYHRRVLKFVQKLNHDIKKTNSDMLRNAIMRELRSFVKMKIPFDKIVPENLSFLKEEINKLDLKLKAEPEAYEYIISVLMDILHIIESKAGCIVRQNENLKQLLNDDSSLSKQRDGIIIDLKREYHEALKAISGLKQMQAQLQKENALLKNQQQLSRQKIRQKQVLDGNKVADYELKYNELEKKSKGQYLELTERIQQLKNENRKLQQQIQALRGRQLDFIMEGRKEFIFEDKIKETWKQFDRQRQDLQKQADKWKAEGQKWRQKYESLDKRHYSLQEEHKKLKQNSNNHEIVFMSQLQQLKKLHSQTKQAYEETYQSRLENQKMFRGIENMTNHKNSQFKRDHFCKSSANWNNESYRDRMQRQNYSINNIHQKSLINSNFRSKNKKDEVIKKLFDCPLHQEVEGLKTAITDLQNKHKNQQNKHSNLQVQYQHLKNQYSKLQTKYSTLEKQYLMLQKQYDLISNKCGGLEEELVEMHTKFTDCLSEIESAKQKERSLYEQSIVRLLTNIEKKEHSDRHFYS